MMLPATANRYQPALAIIQAGTFARERAMRADAQAVNGGMRPLGGMAQAAPAPPKDMQAINEHYFGVSLTPMEAMFAMIEKAVGFLNDKMDVGSDGDPKAVEAGGKWRERALIKNVGAGSADDFRIPTPGENGVSFRQVARMVLDRFKTEFLNGNSELRKLLEETVGFRLDGMSVSDLFEALAEPGSDAAKRVYETISEGLAGQAGSKTSQRLEMAAMGPLSDEETLAAQENSSIDVVDQETIAEDKEAVKNAKAMDKLEEASQVGEPDVDVTIVAQDNVAATPDQRTHELRGLLAHYLEFIDGSNFDKKQKFATRL